MLDVVALLLTRLRRDRPDLLGLEHRRSGLELLGRDQRRVPPHAPAWAGDEVRPYLAAHAYLLGSFTEFHRLGSFQRLDLSLAGLRRATASTARSRRVRPVLRRVGLSARPRRRHAAAVVVCQLFLLNRSPHLEDLNTDLFDRVRARPAAGGRPAEHPARAAAGGRRAGVLRPAAAAHRRPLRPGHRRRPGLGSSGSTAGTRPRR